MTELYSLYQVVLLSVSLCVAFMVCGLGILYWMPRYKWWFPVCAYLGMVQTGICSLALANMPLYASLMQKDLNNGFTQNGYVSRFVYRLTRHVSSNLAYYFSIDWAPIEFHELCTCLPLPHHVNDDHVSNHPMRPRTLRRRVNIRAFQTIVAAVAVNSLMTPCAAFDGGAVYVSWLLITAVLSMLGVLSYQCYKLRTRFDPLVGKAEKAVTVCCALSVVYALFRMLCVRVMKKNKTLMEGLENLKESHWLKLFDNVAVILFIPSVIKYGPKGAMQVYGFMRSILNMIRTTCEGVSIFNMIFKDKDDSMPFIGQRFVDPAEAVGEVADELDERLEGLDPTQYPVSNGAAHRAAHKKVWDEMRKIWSKGEESNKLRRLELMVKRNPWLLPIILLLMFCLLIIFGRWYKKKVVLENKLVTTQLSASPIVVTQEGMLVVESIAVEHFNEPLVRVLTKSETVVQTIDEDVLERTSRKDKAKQKRTEYGGKEKAAGVIEDMADDTADMLVKFGKRDHGVTDEDILMNEDVDPNDPYDLGKHNALYNSRFEAVEKQQKNSDFMIAKLEVLIRQMEEHGKSILKQDVIIPMITTPAVMTQEEAEFKNAEICHKPNCSCPKVHNVQSKSQQRSDKKKIAKVLTCHTCNVVGHGARECPRTRCRECGKFLVDHKDMKFCLKMESKLNGEQKATGLVQQATMYAQVGDGPIRELNATHVSGGLVTNEHLWDGPDDQRDVLFTHKLGSFSMPRSKAVRVRDDLVIFQNIGWGTQKDKNGVVIPKIPSLKVLKAEVGLDIFISSYSSVAQARAGLNSCSTSTIASISGEPGKESGYTSYSSDYGHCGSPICDSFGRCVGIHQRGGSQNAFIPCVGETGKVLSGKPNF